MIKKLWVAFAVAALTCALNSVLTLPLWAADSPSRSIITKPVDETQLVTLAGNTRFEAKARNDRGRVPDDLPLDHMLLQLKRPADIWSVDSIATSIPLPINRLPTSATG